MIEAWQNDQALKRDRRGDARSGLLSPSPGAGRAPRDAYFLGLPCRRARLQGEEAAGVAVPRLRQPRTRLEMCREEVRLNHRLAPAYYLGVDSIVRREDDLYLVADEQPGAVEYVVRMRRSPEERTLASLAVRGRGSADRGGRRRSCRQNCPLSSHSGSSPASGPRSRRYCWSRSRRTTRTLGDVGPPALAPDRLLAAERFTTAFLAARRDQISEPSGGGTGPGLPRRLARRARDRG